METDIPAAQTANLNDLLPRFWTTVQKAVSDAVAKGELELLEFGVIRGSPKQIAAFHADLDKRLATFSKTL